MLKLVLYALSHTIVKGKKVNLSICLIKYLAIKTWRSGGMAPLFLNLALGVCQLHTYAT